MSNAVKHPRGSEWRKWDLHIHSPLSVLNNQYPKTADGSPDWQQFINQLEEIEDISVIGITDYFSINGYKKIQEYRKEGRLGGFDLILPNIEFRLDTFVVNEKSKDINFHVIFSDEIDTEVIEREFIEALDIKISGSVSGLEGARQLNARSIREIGDLVKQQHEAFTNDSVEEAAFKNITVPLEQIQKLLRKDIFTNKFLYVLSGPEWSHIDWNQAYLTKKNLLQTAHILETGSTDTIKWALGMKDLSKEDFIKEFGVLKPCIFGSDAHRLENICKPKDDKFCWIKADPTFTGLMQIIHEPAERVFIGSSPIRGKNEAKVIDRIEIKDSNNWFEEKPIHLNENLVATIGEKGAGKTALADLIALAGGDFNTEEEDQASFVFKALKATKQIEETINDCIVEIHWQDGSSDSFKVTDDFSDYKDSKKIRYLSQTFIERKCSPEKAGELQQEIENIVFQHIPSQDRLGQTTFSALRWLTTESLEVKKANMKKNILKLNKDIYDLEVEIAELGSLSDERENLLSEIQQLTEQKPKPRTDEEKIIEEKLALLTNKRNELDEQIAELKAQLSVIETIKVKVENLRLYVDQELEDIKENLSVIGLDNLAQKLRFSVEADFDALLQKKKGEVKEIVKKIQGPTDTDLLTKFKDIDLETLTTDYIAARSRGEIAAVITVLESRSTVAVETRKVIKLFEENIRRSQKRASALEKKVKEIENVKKPLLPAKREERNEAFKEYCVLLEEEKTALEELYAPLKERLEQESPEMKDVLEFFSRVELDVDKFFGKARNLINFGRRGTYFHGENKLFKIIKAMAGKIELAEMDIYDLVHQLYITFEEYEGNAVSIKEQLLDKLNLLDFYNWIFDVSEFSVTYSIKYQGTNIELLSPGKKGIVLLLMYLVLDIEGSIPLVIDQPEENLDNKSVYPYLVDYFRNAKKRRQIIIITHNPNLVLNTDAEQIIVANFEVVPTTQDSRIKYISGAIENSYISEKAEIPIERQGIKQHGIDILEGGPEAFKKRKDRYEK